MSGRSKVKSSLRGKDNDQTCLWMDKKPNLPIVGWSNVKSSSKEKYNNQELPTSRRSNIKSSPRGKDNEQNQLWVDDQIHVIAKWKG